MIKAQEWLQKSLHYSLLGLHLPFELTVRVEHRANYGSNSLLYVTSSSVTFPVWPWLLYVSNYCHQWSDYSQLCYFLYILLPMLQKTGTRKGKRGGNYWRKQNTMHNWFLVCKLLFVVLWFFGFMGKCTGLRSPVNVPQMYAIQQMVLFVSPVCMMGWFLVYLFWVVGHFHHCCLVCCFVRMSIDV